MSKGSAPPAPDYVGAANAQGEQSQALSTEQTYANRPDVTTPWGSLDYNQSSGYDPGTGQPITNWNENVNLTPQEQQSVENQQNISAGETGTASTLLNGITSQIGQTPATAQPTTQMTGAGAGINYNPASMNPEAENAVWNQFQNMQVPLQQQQNESTQAQLSAQGLKPGDAAYDTAMKNLSNTQYTQDQTAEDQAVTAGQQEASTLFGEQLGAQGQGFGQSATQNEYNNSLIPQNISNQESELGLGQEQSGYDVNLLNGLLNGQQVGMPSFPGTTSAGSGQAADLLGATQSQGSSMLNAYNAQVGQSNSNTAAGAGIIGGLLAAFA